jgi:predicted nucleic acid-binding protein
MLFNEDVPPVVADLLASLHTLEIVIPALWYWETANSALLAIRRARLKHQDAIDQLRDIRRLRITVDGGAMHHAFDTTVELAARHGLTVYDAAYLELAVRRDLPLATLDDPLAEAARAEGVEVIGG